MKMYRFSSMLAFACAVIGAVFSSAVAAETSAAPTPQEMQAEYEAKVLPLQEQLHAKRMELAALHSEGSPDQEKVQQLVQEIAGLQANLYNARLEMDGKYRSAAPYGPGFHHGRGRGMGDGYYGRGWGGGHHGGHGGHYGW